MKKILLTLFVFLFSTNIYSAPVYHKYLKYKNFQPAGPQRTIGETFDQNKYYVGFGLGYAVSNTNTYSAEVQNLNLPDTSNISLQPSFFVGYNINSFLAVELEYNLESKNSESGSYIDDVRGNVDTESTYNKNNMYFTNLVIKYPYLYKHIPFVKLGVGYSKFNNSYTKSFEGVWGPSEEKFTYRAKSYLLKVGLGYEYMINKNNSLQLEYDYVMSQTVDVTQITHDKYASALDKSVTFKKALKVDYSKINVSYKFSF